MPCHTNNCEIMSKLVCNASLITDHDYRRKRKVCNLCDLGIREDVNHIVMQCPNNRGTRKEMLDVIRSRNEVTVDRIFSHSEVYFTVKDLWSPMGVLQRGQKVKLM